MARVKNATFAGSPPRDVVADASIFNRWMENAIGDTALVTDKATGANSETPITHTGAGNGCQLRLPKAAQHIDRSLVISGSAIAEQGVYVLAVPVFIPAGEQDRYRLEVVMRMPLGVDAFATIMNSSGTVTVGPVAGVATETGDETSPGAQRVSRQQSVVWDLAFSTVGIHYLLVSRTCFFADSDPDGRLISWTLTNGTALTAQPANGLSLNGGGAAITSPYEAPSTFTPSTVHDTYDEEIGVGAPLSAYVLTRLNRHLNALWEYVTGAKIPGNAAYKNATTWDNSRASFTAEGLLDFPMCILALGSILDDTGKPSVNDYTTTAPTDGMLDWVMHPVAHSTTARNITSAIMVCPSFSTSSSALKCAVLIHTPNSTSDAANWRFEVDSTAGTATAVAPVQIGSTNFHVATVAAVPFTASATNAFNVRVAHTANAALTEEIDILGCCFYFDP